MKFEIVTASVLLSGALSAQSITLLGEGIAQGISADGTTVVGGSNLQGAWSWTSAGGQQTLPGSFWAYGVSGDGSTVFGEANNGSDAGAVWTSSTSWQSIGGLVGGSGGCPNLGSPYNIDDTGDVAVGLGWDGCSAFAYRWTSGGGLQQLPQMGPFSSRANDVSGDGMTIGGWDEGSNGTRRAAIWKPNGTEELILVDPVQNPDGGGEVWGFSTDGTWACGSDSFTGQAFRWSESTGVELLGSIPGFQGTTGMAISDDGKTVVGFAGIAFFGITAFIWTEDAGIQRFVDFAGAQGINIPGSQDFQILHDMTPDGLRMVGYVAADAGPFSTKTPIVFDMPADCGISTYGEGASAANYLDLAGSGGTSIGQNFVATTSGAVGSAVVTAVSLAASNFPLFDGVGLVDPFALVPPLLVETPVGGTAANTITIPNLPALVSVSIFFQSFSDDASQSQGFGLSNGLQLTVCP